MKWIVATAVTAAVISVAGGAGAQTAPDVSKTANPELVGALATELGATPQQAEGAAGALFSAAKTKMAAPDWGKVSAAVPGIDGLLKAAPAASAAGGSGAGAAAGALAMAGGGGGLAAASAFTKLGLKPELVAKAVPVLTQYVTKSGGANVAALLAGALK